MVKIEVENLHPQAVIPRYQTAGSAGFDLHSVTETIIKPAEWALLQTGIAFAIPQGFEIQIRSRSGLALHHGIVVLNSPGTIDSDYRGEIGVILANHSKKDFAVKIGDRIAQGVIASVVQAKLVVIEKLSQTSRGKSGFGSTGV